MGRYRARDVAVDLAFNAGLVLIGALVVWVTGWDRFWVYAAALAIGWSVRLAVQHRRATRAAGVAPRDDVRR